MSILLTHCSDCIHNKGVDNMEIDCAHHETPIRLSDLEKWSTCAAQHWPDDSPNKKIAFDRISNGIKN